MQAPMQTPKGIGPRTPVANESLPDKKKPFPTSVSELGPPPADAKSYAPPFSRNSMRIFGKLTVVVIRGKNLKAGQGTFGRANPYVRIKVGHKEVITRVHTEGGKNPVSFSTFVGKRALLYILK